MTSSRRRWRFRPPWWAWLFTPLLLALLISLGTWQLGRGQQKLALQASMDNATAAAPIELTVATPAPSHIATVSAVASGVYDAAHQLLLDNQTQGKEPGYHVLTPLRLQGGGLILVNRGWLPQNPDRQILPVLESPTGEVVVRGLWRPLPEPGLRLQVDNCAARTWPKVVQYPTVADLHCLYPEAIAAGVLLLDPQAAGGYLRQWSVSSDFPPQRHFGYAAQWYMFAATLLFLFIKLNLKRSHD